jgi:TonB family protein
MEREPGEDVVEWPGGVEGAPPGKRPHFVLRVGRVAIPVAAVAWGLSISAHAALVLVGVAVWHHSRPNTPPKVAFAQGNGGTGFGVYRPGGEGFAPMAPLLEHGRDDPPSHTPSVVEDTQDVTEIFSDTSVISLPDGPAGALVGIPSSDGAHLPTGWGAARPPQSDGSGSGTPAGTATSGGSGSGSGTGDGTASGNGNEGSPGVAGGVGAAHLPAPVYPRESRRNREQGTVVLEVDVGADGLPSAVRVLDDAGYPRLAGAAVEAVKRARFMPALRLGAPVAATVRIPFVFTLRGGNAARPHP